MQQALDFVRLRIEQIGLDLEVYRELGPVYEDEVRRVVAVLSELERIATAIETFMAVRKSASSNTS